MFIFIVDKLNTIVLKHKTSIIRREHFNAAHRLHNSHWSDEKNNDVFGKCNNEFFHGHNYEMEVKITGFCDEKTGYVVDTKKLSILIKREIINYMDHKNLNVQVSEFKELNPTVENIARVIYERLVEFIDDELDLKITLYETPRNYAEYPA